MTSWSITRDADLARREYLLSVDGWTCSACGRGYPFGDAPLSPTCRSWSWYAGRGPGTAHDRRIKRNGRACCGVWVSAEARHAIVSAGDLGGPEAEVAAFAAVISESADSGAWWHEDLCNLLSPAALTASASRFP